MKIHLTQERMRFFFPFIVDTESNSAASDNTAETETERTHLCTNGEFDNEHKDGTNAII